MGEMAEDILDGSACAICGCYFKHPKIDPKTNESIGIYSHGYPVACDDCWSAGCGYEKCDDDVETF
jgi:hypothetical protein